MSLYAFAFEVPLELKDMKLGAWSPSQSLIARCCLAALWRAPLAICQLPKYPDFLRRYDKQTLSKLEMLDNVGKDDG